MAMAGLGSPAEIWRWPFHYYKAVRAEYLKIVGMVTHDDAPRGEQIARGVYLEKY